jgi:signal transduction histidine kinase
MARSDAIPNPGRRLFSRAKSILNSSTDAQHLFVLLLLLILYVISTVNYLVFHSLIEIFTIVVASCIFVVTWNTRKYLGNNFFIVLGIAYLFVSIINVTHLLAYKGMNVFPEYGANLATQLWIAGRYLEAFSLLGAAASIFWKLDYRKIFAGYAIVTALLLASIFFWKIFPACYIEGLGLTPFKIYSEYVIALIIAVSLAVLVARRRQFEPRVFYMLAASFALAIMSGLAFTLYRDVYDIFNFTGHAFRLLAFYLIYLAIVQTGLKMPYDLIFRDLKKSEAGLTATNAQLEDAKKQAELYVDLMGHDINNMNQIGVTSLELALEDGRMDDDTRSLIKRSLSAFNGSSALIDNVKKLQLAKEQKLEQGLIDIGEVMAAVVEHYKEVAPGATISYEPASGCLVKGNDLLYDAFSNLVGNAIKHADGPVDVCIGIGRTDENGRSFYRIAIEDNGSGIPDERKRDIFDRFKQGQTKAKGSGLGLYLVRTIVEGHGGRVWVEDRVPGDFTKGSRFVVMLPAATG